MTCANLNLNSGMLNLNGHREFNGNLLILGSTINLNGHELVINGDLQLSGNINLNGKKLIVNGSLTHTEGSITNSVDAEGLSTSIEYFKDENNINRYWEEKAVTDRNGNKTRYERDPMGNITKITNPDNSYKEMGYDNKNNLIWEKDETGRYTFYIFDEEGIYLLKKVQPLNGTDQYVEGESDEEDFAITHYAYYTQSECQQLGYKAKGLLKSITDPENNTTTYTYDAYGNVETVEDPQTHKLTRYEYNEIGWKAEADSHRQGTGLPV